MTVLPNNLGAVILGSCLRDPHDIPWGRGVSTAAPLPHGPCPDCHDRGWIPIPDPFVGGTLDARCPCGGT